MKSATSLVACALSIVAIGLALFALSDQDTRNRLTGAVQVLRGAQPAQPDPVLERPIEITPVVVKQPDVQTLREVSVYPLAAGDRDQIPTFQFRFTNNTGEGMTIGFDMTIHDEFGVTLGRTQGLARLEPNGVTNAELDFPDMRQRMSEIKKWRFESCTGFIDGGEIADVQFRTERRDRVPYDLSPWSDAGITDAVAAMLVAQFERNRTIESHGTSSWRDWHRVTIDVRKAAWRAMPESRRTHICLIVRRYHFPEGNASVVVYDENGLNVAFPGNP